MKRANEPLSDAELDAIRAKLVEHDACATSCAFAPDAEAARLVATIDSMKLLASAQAIELKAARVEIDALLARERGIVSAVLEKHNAAMLAIANEIGAEQLQLGAKTMRDGCAMLLRQVAEFSGKKGSLGAALALIAEDYAKAIEALPLPNGEPTVMSPAPGARGIVLYKDERVMVCRVTLEPGAEWPEETHPDHVEKIVDVSGGTQVILGNVTWAGLRMAPSGDRHTIRNLSATEPAEYISVLRRV